MNRKGSAIWEGGFKDGHGTISTESGALSSTPYSVSRRFGEEKGTNPEELIGAAHASCFSMALSLLLGEEGLTAERIETTSTVTLEKDGDGFSVTKVHLDVQVRMPGADPAKFDKAAQKAKAGCPISKLLNAEISMDTRLQA